MNTSILLALSKLERDDSLDLNSLAAGCESCHASDLVNRVEFSPAEYADGAPKQVVMVVAERTGTSCYAFDVEGELQCIKTGNRKDNQATGSLGIHQHQRL